MMIFPKIRLKKGKEQSLRRFHRWVFSGAIEELPTEVHPGDWVEVYSRDDRYLATGYYQDSNIAVRIVSFVQTEINLDFWKAKIASALDVREKLGFTKSDSTNCFRLVNAEGDELPGLVIDWYNGTAVLQSHSDGVRKNIQCIADAVAQVLGDSVKAIFHKPSFPYNEDPGDYLYGAPDVTTILENGLIFHINLERGQKTGYFLDQRENRRLLRKVSSGAKVLDAFCYAGGFSANALKGGATWVDAVDIAPVAGELTRKNLEINDFEGKFNFIQMDVLKYIQGTAEQYDVMVLDPPAYAKHLSSRHNAVQGYKRLNAEALGKIKSGGYLFTFSCSQVVDKKLFENTIMAAAIEAGRMARVIYRLGQPADHPVNIFHPESEYLKGLVLQVE